MNQKADSHCVPEGLRELLAEFTYRVLKDKPANIHEFGYEFFARKTGKPISPASTKKVRLIEEENRIQDNDEDEDDELNRRMQQQMGASRRRGVAAESFDPEAVEDYEKVVHEKTTEQKEKLRKVMEQILIFRSLERDQLDEVIDAVYERRVQPEEMIIKQGDDGDNFYVIESGLYDILIHDKSSGQDTLVGHYDNKGSFGELALMYNCPRAATVIAKSPGVVWAMDRDTFRRIVLIRAFQKRQRYENLIERVPLLQELSHYERMNVADALKSHSYADGDVILEQGEEGHSMYFIESGNVKVIMKRQKSANDRQVNFLGPNDYFGELALLTKQSRAASVIAQGECKVAELDVDSFERLMGPCEEVMKRNFAKYKDQLMGIFGSLDNLPDFR